VYITVQVKRGKQLGKKWVDSIICGENIIDANYEVQGTIFI